MSDAQRETKPRSNKRFVPGDGGDCLSSRFGVASVFQLALPEPKKVAQQKEVGAVIVAVAEQLCFDGIQLRGKVVIPANSNLWPKLPSEREKG